MMYDLGFLASTLLRALSKKPNEIGPNLNFYGPAVVAAEIHRMRFGSIFGSKPGSLEKPPPSPCHRHGHRRTRERA